MACNCHGMKNQQNKQMFQAGRHTQRARRSWEDGSRVRRSSLPWSCEGTGLGGPRATCCAPGPVWAVEPTTPLGKQKGNKEVLQHRPGSWLFASRALGHVPFSISLEGPAPGANTPHPGGSVCLWGCSVPAVTCQSRQFRCPWGRQVQSGVLRVAEDTAYLSSNFSEFLVPKSGGDPHSCCLQGGLWPQQGPTSVRGGPAPQHQPQALARPLRTVSWSREKGGTRLSMSTAWEGSGGDGPQGRWPWEEDRTPPPCVALAELPLGPAWPFVT